MPLFQREHIHIEVSAAGGMSRLVLTGPGNGATFEIPGPGVYSISGPNQCGKTLLLKYLMGVAPVRQKPGATDTYTYVDGQPVAIRHVSDAHRSGLVAVFHEDRMFPTMTVRQQMLMRHSPSVARALGGLLLQKLPLGKVRRALETILPEEQKLLQLLTPPENLLNPHREVLDRAANYLKWWRSEDFMDRYPSELSTGALAMARLLQALVTKRIRVLFLDEALSGVEAAVWPRLVDRLKVWQEKTHAAVVVVTHNEEELIRWSPTHRYTIRDCQLVRDGAAGYSMLVAGLPAQTTETPVFEAPHDADRPWLPEFGERIVVLVDELVRPTAACVRTLDLLKRWAANETTEAAEGQTAKEARKHRLISIPGGEHNKTFDAYCDTLLKVLPHATTLSGTFVLIGGGVTLNLGGLVAATIYRGRFKTIAIPTTVMAIADVAIGSKTGVNLVVSGRAARKHAIGVYANPDVIVFDPAFLETLPSDERILGLAECVKHGLLQDEILYAKALQVAADAPGDVLPYYECAIVVARLKSRVLAHDPWERGYGRLLQFGHLHAHSLERANGLMMPHGSAVFYGVLMDLLLNRFEVEYKRVLTVVRARSTVVVWKWFDPPPRALRRAYVSTNGRRGSEFGVLTLSRVGEYAEPAATPPHVQHVTWEQIERAREELRKNLQMP